MTATYGLHAAFVETSDNPGGWSLVSGYALGALGSVLILIAFLGMESKLLPGWAVYLGRISFGLYVYHDFALSMIRHIPLEFLGLNKIPYYPLQLFLTAVWSTAIPFGLTLLMAAVSYRYFETPFLKLKKRHMVIESQPILGPD
jgi:peptidoglycan/LPS O-acetylase OafA/YrhL